jgi:hypothetical protein
MASIVSSMTIMLGGLQRRTFVFIVPVASVSVLRVARQLHLAVDAVAIDLQYCGDVVLPIFLSPIFSHFGVGCVFRCAGFCWRVGEGSRHDGTYLR